MKKLRFNSCLLLAGIFTAPIMANATPTYEGLVRFNQRCDARVKSQVSRLAISTFGMKDITSVKQIEKNIDAVTTSGYRTFSITSSSQPTHQILVLTNEPGSMEALSSSFDYDKNNCTVAEVSLNRVPLTPFTDALNKYQDKGGIAKIPPNYTNLENISQDVVQDCINKTLKRLVSAYKIIGFNRDLSKNLSGENTTLAKWWTTKTDGVWEYTYRVGILPENKNLSDYEKRQSFAYPPVFVDSVKSCKIQDVISL